MAEPPIGTRLVLCSENLLDLMGARSNEGDRLTFEWGEPDANGWYTPVVTAHSDDNPVTDCEDRAVDQARQLQEAQERVARLEAALDRVMRNVVCGEWYDDLSNDRANAAVSRLHDAEREMWALYDEFGIDPGDSYIRRPKGWRTDDADIDRAVDHIEAILQPNGRCAVCGGGETYWKHSMERAGGHDFLAQPDSTGAKP